MNARNAPAALTAPAFSTGPGTPDVLEHDGRISYNGRAWKAEGVELSHADLED